MTQDATEVFEVPTIAKVMAGHAVTQGVGRCTNPGYGCSTAQGGKIPLGVPDGQRRAKAGSEHIRTSNRSEVEIQSTPTLETDMHLPLFSTLAHRRDQEIVEVDVALTESKGFCYPQSGVQEECCEDLGTTESLRLCLVTE